MNVAALVSALGIPKEALVEQRVPKKLLLEQGAPTAADKRQIQDGIEEITWVAALKPANIGVPAFRDAVREYLEIAVLTVMLRSTAKPPRLIELIHRAIPYPLVLITQHGDGVNFSLAHKRWSQGEAGKVVIEDVRQIRLNVAEEDFLGSLAISRLPRQNLYTLYQGWIDREAALEAARITGVFELSHLEDRASGIRDGLSEHARLTRDIALLRAQASKEKQVNRRVKLNVEIRALEATLAHVTQSLGTGLANESH